MTASRGAPHRTRVEIRSGWDSTSTGHLVCLVQACVKGPLCYVMLCYVIIASDRGPVTVRPRSHNRNRNRNSNRNRNRNVTTAMTWAQIRTGCAKALGRLRGMQARRDATAPPAAPAVSLTVRCVSKCALCNCD